MVTLASLRVCKGEPPFEGGFTSSHEGILRINTMRDCGSACAAETKSAASMPLNLGGLGLRDAVRVAVLAYWASLADCTPMVFNMHPNVANLFVHELEGVREGALGAAAEAGRDLAHGVRPPRQNSKTWSFGVVVDGNMWQPRRWSFNTREELSTHMGPSHRAQVRSHLTRIPPHLFRVATSPVPIAFRCTLAGVAVKLTSLTMEHRVHEQACSGDEGSHWKVPQPEFAGRPVGGSPPTSWFAIWTWGDRCTQVGSCRGWAPLCSKVANWLWTPQLSVLSIVMGPHTEEQRTWMGWFCTEFAAGRSEHSQNWWALEDGPALFVVLGIEVGGRMSTETTSFLSQLAKARARQETTLMRRRAEQAWRMRWGSILACATARAVATSLHVPRMVTHLQRKRGRGPLAH